MKACLELSSRKNGELGTRETMSVVNSLEEFCSKNEWRNGAVAPGFCEAPVVCGGMWE